METSKPELIVVNMIEDDSRVRLIQSDTIVLEIVKRQDAAIVHLHELVEVPGAAAKAGFSNAIGLEWCCPQCLEADQCQSCERIHSEYFQDEVSGGLFVSRP